jgi:N-acetylglucosaminyldiphosphoundecaprenol N-acetyl-beta-D-mannosaminyltransferase
MRLLRIQGIPVHDTTLRAAARELSARAAAGVRTRVSFLNADCVNLAHNDPAYAASLESSDRVYADGAGLEFAARWQGTPLTDNVNGTDLFPCLLEEMGTRGLRLYLLGGRPGVATEVADWVRARHPGVEVVGSDHGYHPATETSAMLRRVRRARPDVLLVAMGAPRQEAWLRRHLEATGAPVGLGVGGLFDFYSGRIPRAPRWLRSLRLEWGFRLLQEPGRLWRRYLLGNPRFLLRTWAASRVPVGALP